MSMPINQIKTCKSSKILPSSDRFNLSFGNKKE